MTRTSSVTRHGLRSLATLVVSLLACVTFWQVAILVFEPPAFLIPAPASVGRALIEHRAQIFRHAAVTLSAAGLGLACSLTLAAFLSGVFVANRLAMKAAMPLVIAFRSAPVVAIAPIVMLLVGRGIGTSIVVVVIISFFPLLVNLMRGLATIETNAVELLRVYGASRSQQLWLLRVPFALPYLFTGLRIAGANALLGAMLSEWITGSQGLGYLILQSGELRELELLWAAVLVAVLIALAVFRATAAAERALVYWRA